MHATLCRCDTINNTLISQAESWSIGRARAEEMAEKERRKTIHMDAEQIAAMLQQQEEQEENERIENERRAALELAVSGESLTVRS